VDCTPCQDRGVTARRVKQGCPAEVCLPVIPSPTHAQAEVCKIAPAHVWVSAHEGLGVARRRSGWCVRQFRVSLRPSRDAAIHGPRWGGPRRCGCRDAEPPHCDVAGRPAGSAALARRRWAQGLTSCRERSSSPGNRGPQSWLMTLMHISCSGRRQPWTDTEPCHPLPKPPSWAAARGVRDVTWAKPRFDSPCHDVTSWHGVQSTTSRPGYCAVHGITSWLLWSSLIDARTT
jgi:hypothetical protein